MTKKWLNVKCICRVCVCMMLKMNDNWNWLIFVNGFTSCCPSNFLSNKIALRNPLDASNSNLNPLHRICFFFYFKFEVRLSLFLSHLLWFAHSIKSSSAMWWSVLARWLWMFYFFFFFALYIWWWERIMKMKWLLCIIKIKGKLPLFYVRYLVWTMDNQHKSRSVKLQQTIETHFDFNAERKKKKLKTNLKTDLNQIFTVFRLKVLKLLSIFFFYEKINKKNRTFSNSHQFQVSSEIERKIKKKIKRNFYGAVFEYGVVWVIQSSFSANLKSH